LISIQELIIKNRLGKAYTVKNVVITGATGMVGNLILHKCLSRPDVESVSIIVRKPTGLKQPKLIEIIHSDFSNYAEIEANLKNQDVAFYCIGVYTGQVPEEEFSRITIDYTKAFAEILKKNSPKCTFCFLSGQGADSSGKSSIMFARDKGIAENILISLNFPQTYSFRPGYIYPVAKRKEPNLLYKIMRVLYKPFLRFLFPNNVITSEQLTDAMVEVGIQGSNKSIFENRDIKIFNKIA